MLGWGSGRGTLGREEGLDLDLTLATATASFDGEGVGDLCERTYSGVHPASTCLLSCPPLHLFERWVAGRRMSAYLTQASLYEPLTGAGVCLSAPQVL